MSSRGLLGGGDHPPNIYIYICIIVIIYTSEFAGFATGGPPLAVFALALPECVELNVTET